MKVPSFSCQPLHNVKLPSVNCQPLGDVKLLSFSLFVLAYSCCFLTQYRYPKTLSMVIAPTVMEYVFFLSFWGCFCSPLPLPAAFLLLLLFLAQVCVLLWQNMYFGSLKMCVHGVQPSVPVFVFCWCWFFWGLIVWSVNLSAGWYIFSEAIVVWLAEGVCTVSVWWRFVLRFHLNSSRSQAWHMAALLLSASAGISPRPTPLRPTPPTPFCVPNSAGT